MARERLLLDTSVVVHLLRGKETGERIDRAYNLRGRPDRPLISVVTVGEALGFAKQRRWGAERVEALRQLLTELVIVDINDRDILERYADLQAESRKSGAGGDRGCGGGPGRQVTSLPMERRRSLSRGPLIYGRAGA